MSSDEVKRTEKLQIMLDDEELKAIDDWRFANRMPSRAAAIRELLRRGLFYSQSNVPTATEHTASTEFRVVTEKEIPNNDQKK